MSEISITEKRSAKQELFEKEKEARFSKLEAWKVSVCVCVFILAGVLATSLPC